MFLVFVMAVLSTKERSPVSNAIWIIDLFSSLELQFTTGCVFIDNGLVCKGKHIVLYAELLL